MNLILLATDGSPSARRAEGEAIELARTTGWPLRVLTVWRMPSITSFGYVPPTMTPELAEVERDRAASVAEDAVERAVDSDVHATAMVREGDPADEICSAAADAGARLVVIGAHGWGVVRRALFGSVSSAVLHHAPCGVLVVRGEETAPEPAAEKHKAVSV